jgi:hypothetical protein
MALQNFRGHIHRIISKAELNNNNCIPRLVKWLSTPVVINTGECDSSAFHHLTVHTIFPHPLFRMTRLFVAK